MSEPEEFKTKVVALESRCSDLDKRLSGFETWVRIGKGLGITAAAVIGFLVSQTLTFERQMDRAQGLKVTLDDLETRTRTLKANQENLEDRTSEAQLLARISDLETPDASDPQLCDKAPWNDPGPVYKRQLVTLANLGVQYLGYLGETPRAQTDEIGPKLSAAATMVSERARKCLLQHETGKTAAERQRDYVSHVKAPLNFKTMIDSASAGPVRGMSNDDWIMCYEASIPVWLQRTGLMANNNAKAYKSDYCQEQLKLPDV